MTTLNPSRQGQKHPPPPPATPNPSRQGQKRPPAPPATPNPSRQGQKRPPAPPATPNPSRQGQNIPLAPPGRSLQERFGPDTAPIQPEGYLPEWVRAGKGPYPGRRVSAGVGSGRKRPISRPKGVCRRGSGQDKAPIRADGLLLVSYLRASGAAGSSQNSRRATLTAAPGYARL